MANLIAFVCLFSLGLLFAVIFSPNCKFFSRYHTLFLKTNGTKASGYYGSQCLKDSDCTENGLVCKLGKCSCPDLTYSIGFTCGKPSWPTGFIFNIGFYTF